MATSLQLPSGPDSPLDAQGKAGIETQSDENLAAQQTQAEKVQSSESDQQNPWGPNFEYLESGVPQVAPFGVPGTAGKPQLVSALRQLAYAYRQEGIYGRRLEIRRIRQARLFWQELQYGWFDPFSMNWRLPTGSAGLSPGDEESESDFGKLMFVTNFYQAFGLSFISVMSQDVPSVVFYPQSVEEDADITSAKAATDAVELIEENNRVADMLTRIGYFLWTDGKIGSYTRYVADGNRFGWQQIDQFEPGVGQAGEDSYRCPQCGTETPAANMPLGGMCPQCGAPLSDENLATAPMVDVPRIAGPPKRIPNGQEVVTIVGGLELNTPIWANELHEFPYLQWQMEVHKAKLKAIHAHVADKIGDMSGVEGPDDTYARIARLGVQQGMPTLHPGDTLASLVTYMRTWIRPWAFMSIKDTEIRKDAIELFGQTGCYVAFAGETYCEARAESMDDCWRVMHALPGDGQSRPSVGNSMIQVQERYNALSNVLMEHEEFEIPPIYHDPQVFDPEAITNTVSEPGTHIPARPRAGMRLADSFFQPVQPQMSKMGYEYMQELTGPIAQMLTGLFPAVYGGSMDDVKTASAYAQARDQALGRLGLVWRRLKQFYADTMMLAVDCFRKNRPEDVQIPYRDAGGQFAAKYIRLMDLKGNLQARPEADETFPRLKSQQKNVLQQLMGVNDPIIQKFFSSAKNLQLVKGIFGLNEFEIPEEDYRNAQLRIIDLLLQGIEVPVDPVMDNHAVMFQTSQEWWVSDKGQEARISNPQGAMMVRMNAFQHFLAMQPPPMLPPEEGAAGAPMGKGGPGKAPPGEGETPQKEAPEVSA